MTDVPASMRAWVIRPDRLGEPRDAMQLETVETPEAVPGEVIVRVMAAGVNYNNVWACLGQPVSVFRYTGYDFHIGGSDASGIVAAVGPGVTRWKPGDEVVVHCNQSCGECPECNGLDPMACSQQKIWAYESNWGSFADYCKVQAQQLLPKPEHLTWAEAASYGLVYFTAYRMLVDQAALEAGHNVLVWGAGGGLGSMAIQLCRLYGAKAIAVVSSEDKADLCRRLGAHAVINRRDYDLTGDDGEPDLDEVKRFGKAIREATGGVDCDIVFEHVGSATFFTTVFVCRTFGKIVTCGATSGFSLTFDVRYLWMRQKTIIGSHFANAYQAYRANQLIAERKILPVLSRTFPFEQCAEPHQMMRENAHLGKMVVLVGAEALSGERRTTSGIEIRPVYGPADAQGDPARIGEPGAFPFTRGLRADGYRSRPWTIRQYAGFGTPQEANERFRFLLAQGQPGLSVAFDLPTQMGMDSDDARALGEVGRVGVAIDTLRDVVALFDGIPLDAVSTSMTINAPAPVLVAMYVVAAELQGVPAASVRGTAQNDVLKEYVARGTYIYPPRPSLRLAADLVAWCANEAPRFNAISLSGYHMREAGSTAVQEMAFGLANAIAYVEAVLAHGIAVDDFAPRLSWIFNTHTNFFEEIAKYRALRRMWATLMRDRFGALDERSLQLRTHTQTGGSTLTLQQPENNIVRAALQALAAVLGGVQSLALSCYDEAIAIPTEHAQTLAVRTQQILAEEIGVTDSADPLGGSWYVEALTDELEGLAWELLAEVERIGGAVAAVETGFYQRAIDEEAYRAEMALESGERVVVGVNRYREGADPEPVSFQVDPALADGQIARLASVRAARDGAAVERALQALRAECERPEVNAMPAIVNAVRARATLGEICGAMRETFGEYKPV